MLAAILRRSGFTFTGASSLSPAEIAGAASAAGAAVHTPAAVRTSAFITRPSVWILETSTPNSSASFAAKGLVFTSAAGSLALGAVRYASTSSRVIRPFGPVPATRARSTPFSLASFFAAGEAKTGAPGSRVTAGVLAGTAAVEEAGACAAVLSVEALPAAMTSPASPM